MAHELFYVTASAPARFSISGRIYNLQAGESRGPFSKQEADQLAHSSDRQRLHIMPVSVPKGQTAPKMDTDKEVAVEPEYRGITQATEDAKFEDPFVANAQESLNLFPDTEPSKTLAEEAAEQTSTKGEVLPEPERGPALTSMTENVVGSEAVKEEEPAQEKPARRTSRRKATKAEPKEEVSPESNEDK